MTKLTAKPAVPPDVLDQTVSLLLTLESINQVRQALTGKLGIAPDVAAAAITRARRRLALAAGFNFAEELGKAVKRLNQLYRRVLQDKDYRAALACQRDLNRLMGLYEAQAKEQAADTSIMAADHEAAKRQLSPLALHDGDAPLAELCRLAVGRIVELEQALHQAKQDGP